MKVDETLIIAETHLLEFGTCDRNLHVKTVRNRYLPVPGTLSTNISGELAIDDLPLVVKACLQRDLIPKPELYAIIEHCLASLQRV